MFSNIVQVHICSISLCGGFVLRIDRRSTGLAGTGGVSLGDTLSCGGAAETDG